MKTLEEKLEHAYWLHDVYCNQKYDKNLPYSYHLKKVVLNALTYNFLLYKGDRDDTVLGAGYHDAIEDGRQTFNNLVELIGTKAAEIVYCCTDEKGKDRSERHSDKYFNELKQNRLAVYVKLCDVFANAEHSKETESSMLVKYRKEFPKLKEELYIQGEYNILWNDLEDILFV